VASPFPGMDPYLEQPAFWSSFHSKFVVALADAIEAQLDAAYYVEVETRSYLENDEGSGLLVGIPDVGVALSAANPVTNSVTESKTATAVAEPPVSIRISNRVQKVTLPMQQEVQERYLEIREVNSGKVITAIELPSPQNKRTGEGRNSYERKRALILGSLTHLIELDLLRAGQAMPMANVQVISDYKILLSRSQQRPQADLYGFSIRDPLPIIPIPLPESDLSIDLQAIFDGVYQRSRYHSRIDYQQPIPPPALQTVDREWADRQLAAWTKL
jgi:virulence-associated protein VagC